MDSNSLSIFTFLIAIATFLSAFFILRSAIATKRTSQGQLFANLLREYSSKEMFDAIQLLGDIRDKRKENEEKFQEWLLDWTFCRFNKNSEAHKINVARRRVTHHFLIALELYEYKKCIGKQFLKVICKTDGFGLLYKINEHLEYAIIEQRMKDPKDKKMKLKNLEKSFTRLLKKSGRSRREIENLMQVRPNYAVAKEIWIMNWKRGFKRLTWILSIIVGLLCSVYPCWVYYHDTFVVAKGKFIFDDIWRLVSTVYICVVIGWGFVWFIYGIVRWGIIPPVSWIAKGFKDTKPKDE